MRMALIGLVLLFASMAHPATLAEKRHGRHQARLFRNELRHGNKLTLATRTDQALDALVTRAIGQLNDAHEFAAASQYQTEWALKFRGFIVRSMQTRDIGDHAPLIQWLADFYDFVEGVIGVQVAKATHISDIKTFNFCIPIVFHPKTFPMDLVTGTREDEYVRHCNKGDVYYGLLPVITYWVVDIGCDIATHGTGVIWACGTIATVAELAMADLFGSPLCQFIYEKANP